MINELKEHLKSRDEATLGAFLEKHPEVLDQTDDSGATGFVLIAYNQLPAVFAQALALKADFNLYEAIISGQPDLVKSRLAAEPSLLNRHSPDGFTPVALAAFFGHPGIAKSLIKEGADPNIAAANPSKVNALHAAVARGEVPLCELLIKHGADVNQPQNQGVTALHSAAHQGNLALVKLLVENGADLTLKMDNGDDALAFAERDGHAEVVAYLKSKT